MSRSRLTAVLSLILAAISLAGCQPNPAPSSSPTPDPKQPATTPTDAVTTERAKLSPEDRALVAAQEWCVISTEERLGSMGAPIKLTIKGQPVFICCKGCKNAAERDPDKTLAKLEELKAKAKTQAQ